MVFFTLPKLGRLVGGRVGAKLGANVGEARILVPITGTVNKIGSDTSLPVTADWLKACCISGSSDWSAAARSSEVYQSSLSRACVIISPI